jgi:hypothetical protein
MNEEKLDTKEHEEFIRVIRNRTLEEVAKKFDELKNFGDTSQSFATFVRNMKT